MIEDRYYVERGWLGGDWTRIRGDGYSTASEAIVVRDRMLANAALWWNALSGSNSDITYRVVRCTREVIG